MSNTPPVPGTSATSPRSWGNVVSSSWAVQAARINHRHWVQYSISNRGCLVTPAIIRGRRTHRGRPVSTAFSRSGRVALGRDQGRELVEGQPVRRGRGEPGRIRDQDGLVAVVVPDHREVVVDRVVRVARRVVAGRGNDVGDDRVVVV